MQKQDRFFTIGQSIPRVDTQDKAFGRVKYTNDLTLPGILHAKLHTSTHAHARIVSIDTTDAEQIEGVHRILTGVDCTTLVGPMLADRPILAQDKVRYHGEPIAMVIADTEQAAQYAAGLIQVEYEPLAVVNTPTEAFEADAPLVHEHLGTYKVMVKGLQAKPKTNIANHTKIRKGNFEEAWQAADTTIEKRFSFSPSDHAALETRVARVEILPDGRVLVYTSTQGPFYVRKLMSQFLGIDMGKISVHTTVIGGAFGGKGTVQLEFLAYLASRAVGGRTVKIANTREEDMITSPVHIGLTAHVKLAANRDGRIQAAKYEYYFDGGAYSDTGAGISKAAAADCTGPYHIENVHCDSYCMYTNHPYATSFRGFGHPELTFAVERTMDMLAEKLAIDPFEIRMRNAIQPGHTTPTQVQLNAGNVGDLPACLQKAHQLLKLDEGTRIKQSNGKILTKGISAFWKTSSTPPTATAGVILTFNTDGSVNLNCSAVELGQGTKTALGQILSEKLKLEMNKIHVTMEVNTIYDPFQWKTVASSTTYLAGRAVMIAADDVIKQLKEIGAVALQSPVDDLDVAGGRVFVKDEPNHFVHVKDLATGYKYPSGHTIGQLIIGEGSKVVRHLTPLDPETGFGKSGPQWSVGVQGIVAEYNPKLCTYEVIDAVTVLDGGTIIHRQNAIGQMRGGMYLGLSWASRESFAFSETGLVENPNFRSYDVLRASEAPNYKVAFVETPAGDGPYGARGIGEYGVIGMAGALGNSLARASGAELNQLPLTPEMIWKSKGGPN